MTLHEASANLGPMATSPTVNLVRLLGERALAEGDSTLTNRLAARVRHLILTGALPGGTRIPSERTLGQELSVSRNTVTKAFDKLRDEGLISSRRGDGTYVTTPARMSYAHGGDRLRSFLGTSLSPHSYIDLRSAALPGLPIVAEMLERLDMTRIHDLVETHGYLSNGLPELRDAVAGYYSDLGLPTESAHILVSSGAQQALRLAASMLVSPGDTVVVEDPTFRGAIESLRALGVRLVGVPSDANGVSVNALQRTLVAERPALVVLQSTIHNPTGSYLSASKRSTVARLAAAAGVPIIDDATLADTCIDTDPLPLPLAAYGRNIITVGSMSKSFWGGLKVGWIRAEPDFLEELAAVKTGEDLGTSLVAQLLSSQLLPRIEAARQERSMTLGAAREATTSAIIDLLPDWIPARPSGGASLWVQLPNSEAVSFAQRAARRGVWVLPGPTFSPTENLGDHLRIAYPFAMGTTIGGIELLASTWREFTDASVRPGSFADD